MVGGLLAGLGVALGAFGAHAWEAALVGEQGDWFDTASRYHLVHGLAVIAAGLAARVLDRWLLAWAGWWLVAGVVLFSGSLYVLALFPDLRRPVVFITPIGGVVLMMGWGFFVAGALSATLRRT